MTTDELQAKFEAFLFEEAWLGEGDVVDYTRPDIGRMFASYQAVHASRDAEVEALRKDAERYRAFRRAAIREDDSFIERVMLRIPDKDCTESQFDEAIDAAMQEESK